MISLLANSCLLLNKPRSSLELLYNVRVVRHHVVQQWRGIRMEVSSCSLGELYQFITKQQRAEGVSVWHLPHKLIFMKCSCCVFLSWYPSELQSMISEEKIAVFQMKNQSDRTTQIHVIKSWDVARFDFESIVELACFIIWEVDRWSSFEYGQGLLFNK